MPLGQSRLIKRVKTISRKAVRATKAAVLRRPRVRRALMHRALRSLEEDYFGAWGRLHSIEVNFSGAIHNTWGGARLIQDYLGRIAKGDRTVMKSLTDERLVAFIEYATQVPRLRRQIDRLGSKALEYGFRFGTRAPDVGRWSPLTLTPFPPLSASYFTTYSPFNS
jgi:hypothetical protein